MHREKYEIGLLGVECAPWIEQFLVVLIVRCFPNCHLDSLPQRAQRQNPGKLNGRETAKDRDATAATRRNRVSGLCILDESRRRQPGWKIVTGIDNSRSPTNPLRTIAEHNLDATNR